jgi:uncharacterized protein (DUF2237 family)
MGLKPGDNWCISLCRFHHGELHHLGEATFAQFNGIDLLELAEEFAVKSPDPTIRQNAGVRA